jgi:hypothetical protein
MKKDEEEEEMEEDEDFEEGTFLYCYSLHFTSTDLMLT